MNYEVDPTGLKDLVAGLKQMDKAWKTEIKQGFDRALQPVVSNIKSALGGGKRASTVRASSTLAGARIRAGGPRSAAPYTGWYEFGGTVTRRKVFGKPTRHFVWRSIAKNPGGYIIYPAATRQDDALTQAMADIVVVKVAQKGGFH